MVPQFGFVIWRVGKEVLGLRHVLLLVRRDISRRRVGRDASALLQHLERGLPNIHFFGGEQSPVEVDPLVYLSADVLLGRVNFDLLGQQVLSDEVVEQIPHVLVHAHVVVLQSALDAVDDQVSVRPAPQVLAAHQSDLLRLGPWTFVYGLALEIVFGLRWLD